MSWLVQQIGGETEWFTCPVACAQYIRDLFGLPPSSVQILFDQLIDLQVGKQLKIPDLSFTITKY